MNRCLEPDPTFVLLTTSHHIGRNASLVQSVCECGTSCINDVSHQSATIVMSFLGTVTAPVLHAFVFHGVEHFVLGNGIVCFVVLLRQITKHVKSAYLNKSSGGLALRARS